MIVLLASCQTGRVFHRPLNVSIDFDDDILTACYVLHNYVRQHDGHNFDDTMFSEGLYELPNYCCQSTRSVNTLCEEFASGSNGEIPLQYNKI